MVNGHVINRVIYSVHLERIVYSFSHQYAVSWFRLRVGMQTLSKILFRKQKLAYSWHS